MGRAMLLAAEHPFRKVDRSRAQPDSWRDCPHAISTIWQSARPGARRHADCLRRCCRRARFPKGPCLVFLFNPFGAAVMRRLLERLALDLCESPGQARSSVREPRAGTRDRVPAGFKRLFLGPGSALPRRRHCRPQDHGQSARWRIRLGQLRGLLASGGGPAESHKTAEGVDESDPAGWNLFGGHEAGRNSGARQISHRGQSCEGVRP